MSAVTSGMVCSHHHLYSTLARGMPAPPRQPTKFIEILEQVWWRLDVALDEAMIRWSAMLGAVERYGNATAIVDHTVAVDDRRQPLAIAGVRNPWRAYQPAYGVPIAMAPTAPPWADGEERYTALRWPWNGGCACVHLYRRHARGSCRLGAEMGVGVPSTSPRDYGGAVPAGDCRRWRTPTAPRALCTWTVSCRHVAHNRATT